MNCQHGQINAAERGIRKKKEKSLVIVEIKFSS